MKKDVYKWPILKTYNSSRINRIAMPLGGIGTGTVSLGGRGNLCDWEIMNRPAKGFTPTYAGTTGSSFILFAETYAEKKVVRLLEGPYPEELFEGSSGCKGLNFGIPRFRNCSFAAAYPFGQVFLADKEVPLRVIIQAFNPFVPANLADSSLPAVILRFILINPSSKAVQASICGSLPAFMSGADTDSISIPSGNRNLWRKGRFIRGIFMQPEGGNPRAERRGTIALTTTSSANNITYRTAWRNRGWASAFLNFWGDFSDDGCLDECLINKGENNPMASLAVPTIVQANGTAAITFLITWHFPNRYSWTPKDKNCHGNCECDWIGNHYTTVFKDAWQAAEAVASRLPELEADSLEFANAFCNQDLPAPVKEAALFNLTALRSQTTFRAADGRFYGWEGCNDSSGCCHGSCTHVWNYEQAVPFLFGEIAKQMRETEFIFATNRKGMMSFRINLPIHRAREFGKAAADGQMGCIMKMYREWQMSGDDAFLRKLWPKAKQALMFCWINGGWDADQDGVMEGCQHNTMDVEYFGPNPQMEGWYLGALRAAGEMARYLGDRLFADKCAELFRRGSKWTDEHLFNGEYYEHQIRPPTSEKDIASCLRIGMGAKNLRQPDYQLGKGCLVDQLVGQFMAHICGLGYLLKPAHVRKCLHSIIKYNRRAGFQNHFNCWRGFVIGDETALLMASYPKERPENPFPYFTEVMTGFEYVAAIGMLFEGQINNGLSCINAVRLRYDGSKRNPFDEAECGHYYARAMASWAGILALTGFHYSGVKKSITFSQGSGPWFWSNGHAWGLCRQQHSGKSVKARLSVLGGELRLRSFALNGIGKTTWSKPRKICKGKDAVFYFSRAHGETCKTHQ